MAERLGHEILADMMLKRSIGKTRSWENYKARWFVLTDTVLEYYSGTLLKRGKIKGQIKLDGVRTVECVDNDELEDKKNVFQILYKEPKGLSYTLYIVAQTPEQQKNWVQKVKQAVLNLGITLFPKYHTGAWTKSVGHYSCCYQIDRNAPGCQLVPAEEGSTSSSNLRKLAAPLPDVSVPNGVEPPTLAPKPKQPNQKKMYIAAYDFKPVEEDDLELIAGCEYEILNDSRDHWWFAKNQQGFKGYIPANYVKKKFDLEIYEWYYKGITRDHSETILRNEAREGCFIVRDSREAGMYTLSIFTNKDNHVQVRHYHIKKNEYDQFYIAEKHAFTTIPDLIYYHKHNSGGIATSLRSPPANDKKAPVTAGFGHSRWELKQEDLEIMDILGTGCYGTVHKGSINNQLVAVKMMKEGTMSEDEFLEEAKTMTQLNHPNLVQLYGIITKTKPLIIVTELMTHGALVTYMKRHKSRLLQKVDSLLDICIQVCQGMEYLESRGFIHRDLAARNCLVGKSTIKVADFGLARFVLDDEYTTSGGKFPVRWVSPEVLSYNTFSSKSDVWAFGVLMWEVFTGAMVPYGNKNNVDVVDYVCHHNQRLDKPQACPRNTYQIMMHCWEREPEQRPSFQQLVRTLNGSMERENYSHVGN